MAMFDGVEYDRKRRFDSDEDFEAFLEKLQAGGKVRVVKSDLSWIGTYLVGFWSLGPAK